MSSPSPVSNELLREVIREVVRDVLRELITEEVAAALRSGSGNSGPNPRGGKPARQSTIAPTSVSGGRHHFTRGALTERHVRAAEGEQATITITRRVVITPLARERAKTSGIEIIRIEE